MAWCDEVDEHTRRVVECTIYRVQSGQGYTSDLTAVKRFLEAHPNPFGAPEPKEERRVPARADLPAIVEKVADLEHAEEALRVASADERGREPSARVRFRASGGGQDGVEEAWLEVDPALARDIAAMTVRDRRRELVKMGVRP